MAITTYAYLHFPGTCAEAMRFYAEMFGGTDLALIPYTKLPGDPTGPGVVGHVMHAEKTIGTSKLMASDFPPGVEGAAQSAVSVMQQAPDI